MTIRRPNRGLRTLAALAAVVCAPLAWAQPGGTAQPIGSTPSDNTAPAQQQDIAVVEHLGNAVPLNLPFLNAKGETVTLADAFPGDRPVVLALVYYDCPVVCGVVMGKLTEAFQGLDFTIGEDFNVVFASIDPSETPVLASSVKDRYLAMYDRPSASRAAEGWSFLTSPADSTRTLAKAVGWEYKPVADGEFSHPVCIFVLTPEGEIARYVYGVGYEPKTMRMALLEASEGKISESLGDKVLMFCFRYDPTKGKYSLAAFRVVQLGGVVSVLGVGALIGIMLMTERIRRRRLEAATPATSPSHEKPAPESTT